MVSTSTVRNRALYIDVLVANRSEVVHASEVKTRRTCLRVIGHSNRKV